MGPTLSSWYFGEQVSIFACYVLPIATAGLSALRHWRAAVRTGQRAEEARRSVAEETAALDVGDRVVHGCVAYARDKDLAVRTTVEQVGTEAESSGSWTVTWEESRRVVDVAPFYVVHASGARVRIEPEGRVKLEADLVATVRDDTTHRHRIASLFPEDPVWVMGLLKRAPDPEGSLGYRDAAGWVMRPAPRSVMTVTRFPPEQALVREAKHARVFSWLMLVLLVAMLLSHTQYHALLFGGRDATATVTGAHTDGSGDNEGYVLDVTVTDGSATFTDTWGVDWESYFHDKPGETYPAFASFGIIRTSVPAPYRAEACGAPTVVTLVVWAVFGIIGLATARSRRWYDGVKVKDVESGRLTQ